MNSIRRIVLQRVVSEASLPYNAHVMDDPTSAHEAWESIVATEPDHEPDKECVVVFCLDARLRPFSWHRVSLGSVSETSAHPREVLRPVIASAAHSFLMMHNHPSGDPAPSEDDIRITRRMIEAAELMQVRLMDHVIVGRPEPGREPYYSFREAGIVP